MNESLKKDIKDLSREELERLFIEEVEQCDKFYNKFIEAQTRLDNSIEYVKNNTYEYRHDMNLKDKALKKHVTKFIDELLIELEGVDNVRIMERC